LNKTEIYEQLENVFGEEVAYKMSGLFGGQVIYVPKTDTLVKIKRNKDIAAKYTGYNIRELASKYNLSENQVRLILKTQNKY